MDLEELVIWAGSGDRKLFELFSAESPAWFAEPRWKALITQGGKQCGFIKIKQTSTKCEKRV